MVKMVFAHIELLQALLLINGSEIVVPCHRWFRASVEIDPYEAQTIDMNVDREEPVFSLVKGRQLLIVWCFGQPPV